MQESKEKSIKLKFKEGIFLVFSELLKHTKIGRKSLPDSIKYLIFLFI